MGKKPETTVADKLDTLFFNSSYLNDAREESSVILAAISEKLGKEGPRIHHRSEVLDEYDRGCHHLEFRLTYCRRDKGWALFIEIEQWEVGSGCYDPTNETWTRNFQSLQSCSVPLRVAIFEYLPTLIKELEQEAIQMKEDLTYAVAAFKES